MGMIGRIVGGALGRAIGKQKGNHPVAGAVIGAGALFAARRLFPQRYAALAAWAAAGYLTKKWAERAEARKAAAEEPAIDPALSSEERRAGKECVVRLDLAGRRIIKKKPKNCNTSRKYTRKAYE